VKTVAFKLTKQLIVLGLLLLGGCDLEVTRAPMQVPGR
jgi:hypothetical protein